MTRDEYKYNLAEIFPDVLLDIQDLIKNGNNSLVLDQRNDLNNKIKAMLYEKYGLILVTRSKDNTSAVKSE